MFETARTPAIPVVLFMAAALSYADPSEAGIFFGPDNYSECILDRVEGVQNDLVAISETTQCRREFPDYLPPEGASSFFFGPDTAAECVAEYAASTPSGYAANQIREACFQLYPETIDY